MKAIVLVLIICGFGYYVGTSAVKTVSHINSANAALLESI